MDYISVRVVILSCAKRTHLLCWLQYSPVDPLSRRCQVGGRGELLLWSAHSLRCMKKCWSFHSRLPDPYKGNKGKVSLEMPDDVMINGKGI